MTCEILDFLQYNEISSIFDYSFIGHRTNGAHSYYEVAKYACRYD